MSDPITRVEDVPDTWTKISVEEYLDWFAEKEPEWVAEIRPTMEMMAPESEFYLTDRGIPYVIWNPPKVDDES